MPDHSLLSSVPFSKNHQYQLCNHAGPWIKPTVSQSVVKINCMYMQEYNGCKTDKKKERNQLLVLWNSNPEHDPCALLKCTAALGQVENNKNGRKVSLVTTHHVTIPARVWGSLLMSHSVCDSRKTDWAPVTSCVAASQNGFNAFLWLQKKYTQIYKRGYTYMKTYFYDNVKTR